MYRDTTALNPLGRQGQEVVVALDTATGNTRWEYRYDAPVRPDMQLDNGPGPQSTPLIVGSRIFRVGAMGQFYAIGMTNGRVLLSHDLFKELAVVWHHGYSCSPIAYKEMVILTTGKKRQSVVAFRQSDGAVVWAKQHFEYSHSSPILINVDGQEQLVLFMSDGPVGLDPSNGELLWTHPLDDIVFRGSKELLTLKHGQNNSTPVWGESNLLFISTGYSGSRALQLSRREDKTVVHELWFSNRVRVHFSNAIRLGDYIYGSSGDFGPSFLTAVNIRRAKSRGRTEPSPAPQ
jgi:outer membrane protein assembly factor BamB